MRWFTLLALLLAFWAGLSGELTTPLLVGFGLVTTTLVTWLAVRKDLLVADLTAGTLLRIAFLYMPWLVGQILVANLRVIRLVWSRDLPIDPRLTDVPTTLRTGLGRATFANSITLTPGTVTVDLKQEHLVVHALTADDAAGAQDGSMEARVRRVEGRG